MCHSFLRHVSKAFAAFTCIFIIQHTPSALAEDFFDFLDIDDAPKIKSSRQKNSAPRIQNAEYNTNSPSAYSVEGLAVGARVAFGSNAYRAYNCSPSNQFDTYTWCRKNISGKESRGNFNASYSILHNPDGIVSYVARMQDPSYFTQDEILGLQQRLTQKYGPIAKIEKITWANNEWSGEYVLWGGARLDPLPANERQEIANDIEKGHGLLVDFAGNFKQSAREGLPIYRVAGGPGFVWVASYNQSGKGKQRFFAVDASTIPLNLRTNSSPNYVASVTTNSVTQLDRSLSVEANSPSQTQQSSVRPASNSATLVALPSGNAQNTSSINSSKRVALIIGNSNYQNLPQLTNPKNDAQDITGSLRDIGFTVYQGLDSSKSQMDLLLKKFSAEIVGAEVALVYYAGHGVQKDSNNYLLPVDLKVENEDSLDQGSLQLSIIEKQISHQSGSRINVIILDACRDNPIPELLKKLASTRSIAATAGLAETTGGLDTLIIYSTAPKQVAADGDGRNSPFTEAFLHHVKEKDVDIELMFRSVFHEVQRKTDGKQIPWKHGNLTTGLKLVSTAASAESNSSQNVEALAPTGSSVVNGPIYSRDGQVAEAQRSYSREAAECDQLAANLYDSRKPASIIGVTYEGLRSNAERAEIACEQAARMNTDDLRYRYQYARAVQVRNPNIAIPALRQLMDAGYPVAADNYGWALMDRRVSGGNASQSIAVFRRGVQLGDSSSMVSLATLIIKGQATPAFANEHIVLLERAAAMGHYDAQEALLKLKGQLEQNALQQRQNEAAARMFLGIVGGMMGSIHR